MNTKKEKYFIPREREAMFTPCHWNSIAQSSRLSKKYYGDILKEEVIIFEKGIQKTVILSKEWDRVSSHIAESILKQKNYFIKLKKIVEREKIKTQKYILDLRKIDFAKQDFSGLIDCAEEIKNVWLSYDCSSMPAWFIGGDKFKDLVKNNLKLEAEEFEQLALPQVKTFVNQLDYDLIAAKIKVLTGASLDKTTKKLVDVYGWIPFGYDGPEYWDEKHFANLLNKQKGDLKILQDKLEALKQIAKQEANKIKKIKLKYNLSGHQLELIDILHDLIYWTDDRKKLEFQLHYFYRQVLLELSRRHGLSYKQLKYLLVEELNDLENKKDDLKKIADLRINKIFAYRSKTIGAGKFLDKIELEKLLSEIKLRKDLGEIKGVVASKGNKNKYIGRVKLVMNPTEGRKVGKGDFLVTTMTTPDFINVMKKAIGYITDEGGVTCHAAIVARELNKPCIIATKIATKVLKENDLIEIDVESGIVKKIRQKKQA